MKRLITFALLGALLAAGCRDTDNNRPGTTPTRPQGQGGKDGPEGAGAGNRGAPTPQPGLPPNQPPKGSEKSP